MRDWYSTSTKRVAINTLLVLLGCLIIAGAVIGFVFMQKSFRPLCQVEVYDISSGDLLQVYQEYEGGDVEVVLSSPKGHKIQQIFVGSTSVAVSSTSGRTQTVEINQIKANTKISVRFAPQNYTVAVATSIGGSVVVKAGASHAFNSVVQIETEPQDGYVLSELYYMADGDKVNIPAGDNEFYMPAHNITLIPVFSQVQG